MAAAMTDAINGVALRVERDHDGQMPDPREGEAFPAPIMDAAAMLAASINLDAPEIQDTLHNVLGWGEDAPLVELFARGITKGVVARMIEAHFDSEVGDFITAARDTAPKVKNGEGIGEAIDVALHAGHLLVLMADYYQMLGVPQDSPEGVAILSGLDIAGSMIEMRDTLSESSGAQARSNGMMIGAFLTSTATLFERITGNGGLSYAGAQAVARAHPEFAKAAVESDSE